MFIAWGAFLCLIKSMGIGPFRFSYNLCTSGRFDLMVAVKERPWRHQDSVPGNYKYPQQILGKSDQLLRCLSCSLVGEVQLLKYCTVQFEAIDLYLSISMSCYTSAPQHFSISTFWSTTLLILQIRISHTKHMMTL